MPLSSGTTPPRRGPLVLAAATPKEWSAILRGFTPHTLCVPAQGEALPLRVNGRDWLFLRTGIGLLNAALSLGTLLGGYATQGLPLAGVINIGVAGSFDLGQAGLGSAAVITREIWPEFGLRTATGIEATALGLALAETRDGALWERIELTPEQAAAELTVALPQGLARGASLSVSGVTGTPEYAALLQTRHDVLFENMEGFALAFACHQAGIPFLELRSISNRVGARPPAGWNLPAALDRLGQLAASLVT